MEAQPSKTLVVDTSVGSAAGNEDSTDQTASCCVAVLKTILSMSYKIAMSEDIEKEWRHTRKKILSYASKWLVLMENRNRTVALRDTINVPLREMILNSTPNKGTQSVMQKDLHLLEAALATDKIVLSRDKKCRRHFLDAASNVTEIKPILWANPEVPEEEVIDWLNRGIPFEKERQLGCSNP